MKCFGQKPLFKLTGKNRNLLLD